MVNSKISLSQSHDSFENLSQVKVCETKRIKTVNEFQACSASVRRSQAMMESNKTQFHLHLRVNQVLCQQVPQCRHGPLPGGGLQHPHGGNWLLSYKIDPVNLSLFSHVNYTNTFITNSC